MRSLQYLETQLHKSMTKTIKNRFIITLCERLTTERPRKPQMLCGWGSLQATKVPKGKFVTYLHITISEQKPCFFSPLYLLITVAILRRLFPTLKLKGTIGSNFSAPAKVQISRIFVLWRGTLLQLGSLSNEVGSAKLFNYTQKKKKEGKTAGNFFDGFITLLCRVRDNSRSFEPSVS